MSLNFKLLQQLADGRFHSGEALGQTQRVSRTAIWKQIKSLADYGIDCYSVRGKGYRLAKPLELLDSETIRNSLTPVTLSQLSALEIHAYIDSTNRHLMARINSGLQSGHACLAEYQQSGRGRRGRHWLSPFGRNIYLSLYYTFQNSPAQLSALGLAVGVAIIRALKQIGLSDAGLKWPNDIYWQGGKLGGILLEMSGEGSGPYHVVMGVGINIFQPETHNGEEKITQPIAALESALDSPLSRNQLAATLLENLLSCVEQFQRQGFAPFIDEWHTADIYHDQAITLHMPDKRVDGHARGIDASGALIVETESGRHLFHAGEVSLRPQGQPL